MEIRTGKECKEWQDTILKKEWSVGAAFRGHDHYSYAIIDDANNVVATPSPMLSFEIADHIVQLHNKSLEKSG